MANKTDPLTGPRVKVEWAKEHFNRLDSEIRDFGATNPYEVRVKRDPQTRKPIYYISRVNTVPPTIPLITGEVLQALMSALDYLAYQLVLDGTGKPGPFDYVYFPIFRSADAYEAGKARKIRGASKAAIKAIDAVKPYKGGNDLLWLLSRLNNIDKHRLLLLPFGSFQSVDIGGLMARALRNQRPGFTIPDLSFLVRPADKGPIEAGYELFIGTPDDEVDENIKFRLEIAFFESGVCEAEPVLSLLDQMVNFVDDTIQAFAPLFGRNS